MNPSHHCEVSLTLQASQRQVVRHPERRLPRLVRASAYPAEGLVLLFQKLGVFLASVVKDQQLLMLVPVLLFHVFQLDVRVEHDAAAKDLYD